MSTATETIERSEGRQGLASMIRRVKIRNYKSIKNCDVELGPFTVLVGRNGSGKSNFLDAIRLVSEAVRGPVERASWTLIPWFSPIDPAHEIGEVRVDMELVLAGGEDAEYSLTLGSSDAGLAIRVVEERLAIRDGNHSPTMFRCRDGRIEEATVDRLPLATSDRPYLSRASSVPEFRPAYDAISAMGFYDLYPWMMRQPQTLRTDTLLTRDGVNFAFALDNLERSEPDANARVIEYLRVIVPECARVRVDRSHGFPTVVFEMQGSAAEGSRLFQTHQVSDGTLRALGILVAINQLASDGRPIRLVGIEEPETALHPAAAGALMDAFRDAASHTQVLVTTHGADLLDRFDPEEDHILAVEYRDGRTEIGPVNPASRDAIREHLFSAGELLRMDQLHPDRLDVVRQAASEQAAPGGGS